MSGYRQQERAERRERAWDRKTVQQVCQDSQGPQNWVGLSNALGRARGGTNGRVRAAGAHGEAGEGLGVQTKCSVLWAYWDAMEPYEPRDYMV
jgi:hypothetical protein